jgi:hypothetical protein
MMAPYCKNARSSPAVRKVFYTLAWSSATTRTLRSEDPLLRCQELVVAPFKDQVDLLRTACDDAPRLTDVQVGTMDKFWAARSRWSYLS